MSRERGYRIPFEFTHATKDQVLKEQDNKCAVTGRTDHLQVHHMLGVGIALGFWPNINPEIIKQRENAVAITADIHSQIEAEIHSWPKEFFRLYTIGLYSYLRDTYYDSAAD